MAVTSQEIQMLSCDAESCEIKAPAVGGKIPAKFHSGTVTPGYLDAEPVDWVACRETHIAKAVVAVEAKAHAEREPKFIGHSAGDEPVHGEDAEEGGDTYDVSEAPEFAASN